MKAAPPPIPVTSVETIDLAVREDAPKEARDFVVTLCRLHDLSERTVGQGALAVSELTTNVIRHAAKETRASAKWLGVRFGVLRVAEMRTGTVSRDHGVADAP